MPHDKMHKSKTQKGNSVPSPVITRGSRAGSADQEKDDPAEKVTKKRSKKRPTRKEDQEQLTGKEAENIIDDHLKIQISSSEEEASTDEEVEDEEPDDEHGMTTREKERHAQNMKKELVECLKATELAPFIRSMEVERAMKAIQYFQALQQKCTRIPAGTSREIDGCMRIVIQSLIELESRAQAYRARCEAMEICVKPLPPTEEETRPKARHEEQEKPQTQLPRGYAEAVKMATSTIIVQAKEDRSVEDVERQIKETANDCQEGVKRIKRIRNGFKLICDNETEATKLKEKITVNEEASAAVKVTSASIRRKKVIIFNVPRTTTEEEIKKRLKKTLGLGPQHREDLVMLHRQVGVRDAAAHQPVLLPEPLADYLLKQKTICLGFRDCPIKAFISVTRCHKCLDYDHVAANCRESQRCTKCSGLHKYTECTARKKCCMACLKYNEATRRWQNSERKMDHEANSAECKTRYHLLRVRQLQSERGMALATFDDIISGRVSLATFGGKDKIVTRTRHDMEAFGRYNDARRNYHGRTR